MGRLRRSLFTNSSLLEISAVARAVCNYYTIVYTILYLYEYQYRANDVSKSLFDASAEDKGLAAFGPLEGRFCHGEGWAPSEFGC